LHPLLLVELRSISDPRVVAGSVCWQQHDVVLVSHWFQILVLYVFAQLLGNEVDHIIFWYRGSKIPIFHFDWQVSDLAQETEMPHHHAKRSVSDRGYAPRHGS